MDYYFIGVDLGQTHDPSTVAVVERKELQGAWDAAEYTYGKTAELRLRYLERIELGTPYPDVVDRLVKIARWSGAARQGYLVVDSTGVGRPVVDLLRRARPGCGIMPVVATGGQQETAIGDCYGVPKRDLIVGLQVLFQTGRLHVATGLPLAAELMQEMSAMRVKLSAAGREQYGAGRASEHDDLVFAVALACWGAKKRFPAAGRSMYRNEAGEALLGLMLRGI